MKSLWLVMVVLSTTLSCKQRVEDTSEVRSDQGAATQVASVPTDVGGCSSASRFCKLEIGNDNQQVMMSLVYRLESHTDGMEWGRDAVLYMFTINRGDFVELFFNDEPQAIAMKCRSFPCSFKISKDLPVEYQGFAAEHKFFDNFVKVRLDGTTWVADPIRNEDRFKIMFDQGVAAMPPPFAMDEKRKFWFLGVEADRNQNDPADSLILDQATGRYTYKGKQVLGTKGTAFGANYSPESHLKFFDNFRIRTTGAMLKDPVTFIVYTNLFDQKVNRYSRKEIDRVALRMDCSGSSANQLCVSPADQFILLFDRYTDKFPEVSEVVAQMTEGDEIKAYTIEVLNWLTPPDAIPAD